ncbi:hypothetical protein L484_017213 [Morus notabilis]|uniref:Uncharacterized protein n=1 Tax=Morus notabilis TaxID=981085 RepID=W9R612_9ROSA|nr:hypothetical protein L484_017213 [Morus notabilis]
MIVREIGMPWIQLEPRSLQSTHERGIMSILKYEEDKMKDTHVSWHVGCVRHLQWSKNLEAPLARFYRSTADVRTMRAVLSKEVECGSGWVALGRDGLGVWWVTRTI